MGTGRRLTPKSEPPPLASTPKYNPAMKLTLFLLVVGVALFLILRRK
jgi:hypothetical protein